VDPFAPIYARGEAAAQMSGDAWMAAMVQVEAALARACAEEGLIPADAARQIADACTPEGLDVQALARQTAANATPVIGLVGALRARVGEPYARFVHLGATSQDIIDTAMMSLCARALEAIQGDLAAAEHAAAQLADEHRATAMSARTLLRQALPTSFGLRAAGWLSGLVRARRALRTVRETELAVQMGGPVGLRCPRIAARVAAELSLAEPVLSWATERSRVAALAGALGALCGVLAKIAHDVVLLCQDEIGELRCGHGGSSAMAHKRNPVPAVSVLACTRRAPGLVATLLACMEQEHERAAGGWQAEWGTLSELVALSGSAASWGRELFQTLEVDAQRMAANLERLVRAGVGAARDPSPALAAASVLIDRALAEACEA
jgi:3-carboxy-cis,cis-muconate cycloisomerase